MVSLNRGFTLLEVVVYVAILSVIIYFIGGFAYNIYTNKDRVETVQEINSNGRFMLDTLTQAVEQSESITIEEQ